MTQRLRLPQLTAEYLNVRVRVDDDTVNPTGWPVEAAWTAVETEPAAGDWVAASWAVGGPPYNARVFTDKPAGAYRLWVRVQSPTETPVRLVALVEFHT